MTKSLKARLNPVRASVTTKIVDVTPELAAEMLLGNQSNRPIQPLVVDNYAREMKAGRWHVNGEAIAFDPQDRLLNGQHRLSGVVKSGVTVRMLIAFDVTPEAFMTMDTGRKRTAADALMIAGVHHSHRSAAAMRAMLNYRDNMSLNRARTNQEIVTAFREEPTLEDFIAKSKNIEKRMRSAVGLVPLYMAHRFGGQPDKVEEFIDGIATGAMMEVTDPRHALREKLNTLPRPDSQIVWNYTTKALNLYLAGRSVRSFRPDRDGRGLYVFSEVDVAPRSTVNTLWGV